MGTVPELTITPILPTVTISGCTITGSPLTFAWDDVYDAPLTDAQSFIVLALPHGAKITYIESWLRLFNGAGTELFVEETVDVTGVGETLRAVPKTTNTGGDRSGTYDGDDTAVAFAVDTYGDIGKLVVYQNHYPTSFEGDVYKSSTATAGFSLLGTPHLYCTPGSNLTRMVLGLYDATKMMGESYTVYYRIYVAYVGTPTVWHMMAAGSFSVVNYQTINPDTNPPNPVYLYYPAGEGGGSATVSPADTVQLWVSNMVFYSRS